MCFRSILDTPATRTGSTLKRRRVLIVDGDADSRTVYGIMLRHHGYEVAEVDDGESALAIARKGAADVLVTELTLRRLDGHMLLQALKDDPATAGLGVVVLTARTVPSDRARAMATGCTKFLTKPLEPQALLREIESLLGPSEHTR
jgi:CheY-like chemotaxis protein